jgi:hypothetical protein
MDEDGDVQSARWCTSEVILSGGVYVLMAEPSTAKDQMGCAVRFLAATVPYTVMDVPAQ